MESSNYKKLKQQDFIYYRFGKPFRKIKRDEIIEEGAMQSWCLGELQPVKDPRTIGQTPSDFSDERDFYNPLIYIMF